MTKHPTPPDEHMTHVEWSGALAAIPLRLTAGKRHRHSWQASSGILALLASLLILNGCDRPETPPTPPGEAGSPAEPPGGVGQTPDAVPPAPEAPTGSAPSESAPSEGAPAGPPGEESAPKP